MHQTIIQLDPGVWSAKRLLDYPYRIHYMLEDINPSRQRVLWRLSKERLLLRHKQPLNWMRLDTIHPDLGTRTHSKMQDLQAIGSILTFNILAYIRKRPTAGQWIIQQPAQYLEWLERQAESGGFQVLNVLPTQAPTYFVRTSSMSIHLRPVELMGDLKISDSNKFEQILEYGVGRMRAFGCGLMLLKQSGYIRG